MFHKWIGFGAVLAAILAYLLFSNNKIMSDVGKIREITLNYIISLKDSYLQDKKMLNENKIRASDGVELFTEEDLKKYTGENGDIYLSILGHVFDVSKGRKHYGADGAYHGFAGRDASKAFITGDFTSTGLTDDISDVPTNELADLRDWLQMYKKDYIFKGYLIGRFYDSNGEPTKFMQDLEKKLLDFDLEKKQEDNYKKYPPCNVEWTPETGSRVWCSQHSGGIKRSFVGVPRKYYKPGSTNHRCACVNTQEEKSEGKFVVYEGCKPDSVSCFIKTSS